MSGSGRPQDPVVLGRDGVLSCLSGSISVVSRTILSILAMVSLIAAGCSASASVQPTRSTSAVASLSAGPSLTPVPGSSNADTPPPASEPPTQTDTEWGRIWDALPRSFPLPPNAVPTETGQGPASATLAVGASADQAAEQMQAGLKKAGYSIEALSGPSEDGSRVIDAVGSTPECRVQVRLTPLSGTTSMVVMFGAGCPFQ